ncbi:MAG: RNA polymerase sigma factor [Myxococcota bacterium]
MAWWDRLRRGRRFDRLVEPVFDGVYRFARSLCRDPILAEDLVQESLLNAMSRLDTLRDDAAFKVWLHRVVYTTHLDRIDREQRHRRRIEAAGAGETVPFPTPADRLDQRQLGLRLAEALAQLPDDQRQAVWLVDVEQMTFADAAEVLDLKPGTVASRVARGRAALRADLSDVARDRGVIA